MKYRFRTKRMREKYNRYIANGGLEGGCRLCEAKTLKNFTYWRIIPNSFPYDRIATVHHMLVPLRHTAERDLTVAEREELRSLKQATYLNDNYEFIIEATRDTKSIPAHLHFHLVFTKW